MDKVKEMERLLIGIRSLEELNLNMTNILSMLTSPQDFFQAIEQNLSIKTLHIAAIC